MSLKKLIQQFEASQANPKITLNLRTNKRNYDLPFADRYNTILSKLPTSSRRKHVARDRDVVMHTDNCVPAAPPTIEERILGQKYLMMRAILQSADHRTFTGHLDPDDPSDSQLDTILSISREEYDEAYQQAKEEVEDYNQRFGPRDSEYPKSVRPEYIQKPDGEMKVIYHITWAFRKWRLGDKVDYPRHSSDDLSEVYEEPTEDKETPSFPALSEYEYDLFYETGNGFGKPSNGKDDNGRETFGLPEMDLMLQDKKGTLIEVRQGSWTASGKRGGKWVQVDKKMEIMVDRPRQMVIQDPRPKFVTLNPGDWFFAPKSWFDQEKTETRMTEHQRQARNKDAQKTKVPKMEKTSHFHKGRDWF